MFLFKKKLKCLFQKQRNSLTINFQKTKKKLPVLHVLHITKDKKNVKISEKLSSIL